MLASQLFSKGKQWVNKGRIFENLIEWPITLIHLMLMSKIYVVNSDMKNVIGMSDPKVMFKGPGSLYNEK